MIFGAGIDVIELDRFRKICGYDENEIIKGTFTPSEINTCSEDKDSARSFAALFAAKEAFLKALGTGWQFGISWKEIVIEKHDRSYEITPSGKAADICKQKKINKIYLSIQPTEETATAVVILEN